MSHHLLITTTFIVKQIKIFFASVFKKVYILFSVLPIKPSTETISANYLKFTISVLITLKAIFYMTDRYTKGRKVSFPINYNLYG